MRSLVICLAIAAITFAACNKTKKYSKRLAGETWKVTELSVDGTNEAELPTLVFENCDIYEESCMGDWKNEEGGHAHFIWQFREKGKLFELSNQSSLEGGHGGHAEEEAIIQASNFSGVYDVKESEKDMMLFESTSTVGFPGQKAVIRIEKQ